ncbi:bacillithiol system redox-active protein YtxJ [Priestia koreensis]|uniref:bacillithiol system redox-active protein YtxJ n=1 Tax=Priestia koreensis TaxID=284581 RepID=UPI00345B3A7D
MHKISTVEEFEEILQKGKQFAFLKHSTTCPISAHAYEEYTAFAHEHEEVPTYYLHVQEARPLSAHIAETFNIKHESPQVFVFENGEPTWNASHSSITSGALTEQTQK